MEFVSISIIGILSFIFMMAFFFSFIEEVSLVILALVSALFVVIISIYLKFKRKKLPVIGLVFSEISLFLILSLFISAFVIPSPSSCRIDTSCLDVIKQVTLEDNGYTCIGNGNVSVQIARGSGDFELVDVVISVITSSDSIDIRLLENNDKVLFPELNKGDVNKFPHANEEKVFIIDTSTLSGVPEEVSVAAVVKSGKNKNTCEANPNPVKLAPCS